MTQVQFFKLIWIDENINEDADIIQRINEFEQFEVCVFESLKEAQNVMKDVETCTDVILICSEKQYKDLIKQIEE